MRTATSRQGLRIGRPNNSKLYEQALGVKYALEHEAYTESAARPPRRAPDIARAAGARRRRGERGRALVTDYEVELLARALRAEGGGGQHGGGGGCG